MLQKRQRERNALSGLEKEGISAVTRLLKLCNRLGALADSVPGRLPRGSSSPVWQQLQKNHRATCLVPSSLTPLASSG